MLLVDQIAIAIDNGDYSVRVFLDFSKAFDTVIHRLLLSKCQHYGIRDQSLACLECNFSIRQQHVSYEGVKSKVQTIHCGSIKCLLLFLVYGNDIHVIFVNDTNVLSVVTIFPSCKLLRIKNSEKTKQQPVMFAYQ